MMKILEISNYFEAYFNIPAVTHPFFIYLIGKFGGMLYTVSVFAVFISDTNIYII